MGFRGPEAEKFILDMRENLGQNSQVLGLERLCNFCPWGLSKPTWIKLSAAWSDLRADAALHRRLDK